MKLKTFLLSLTLITWLWSLTQPTFADSKFPIECNNNQVLLCDFEATQAKEEILEFPGILKDHPRQNFKVKATRHKAGYKLVFYPQKGRKVTQFIPFDSKAGRALKAIHKR